MNMKIKKLEYSNPQTQISHNITIIYRIWYYENIYSIYLFREIEIIIIYFFIKNI